MLYVLHTTKSMKICSFQTNIDLLSYVNVYLAEGENTVAINLIVQHVRTQLEKVSLCKRNSSRQTLSDCFLLKIMHGLQFETENMPNILNDYFKTFPAWSFTIKVALHLRWLTTEKFQNYETVKGGCMPSENKFRTQKNNKLRWLASDINFKLLHTECKKKGICNSQ